MDEIKMRPSQWAMNTGAILGAGLALMHYAAYVFRDKENFVLLFMGFGTFVIIIAGLYLSQKYYRTKVLDGLIRYDQSLVVGIMTGFYASIIVGFYYFVVCRFQPALIDKVMDVIIVFYKENGLGEETIKLLNETKETPPLSRGISMVFNYTMIAFMVSLITSFIVKRKATSIEK